MKFLKKFKTFLRNVEFLIFPTEEQKKLKNLTICNFQKSIIFFTHHKCASSFFNSFILRIKKKEKNFKVINWSNLISAYGHYINFTDHYKNLVPNLSKKKVNSYERFFEKNSYEMFNQYNHIYGPIRNIFSLGYSNKFKKVLIVRHPLDTLVSAYYSFAYTHKPSSDDVQRNIDNQHKKRYQKMKIDYFVLNLCKEWIKPLLNSYMKICQINPNDTIIITYEDLIKNPKKEIKKILKFSHLDSTDSSIEYLLRGESFIQKNINKESHQRSGKSKQYKKELSKITINKINKVLNKEINFFWG